MQGASRSHLRAASSAALFAALLLSVSSLHAAVSARFSGELAGLVTDAAGRTQPGALVFLYNRQEQLLQRTLTDAAGNFVFAELLPDTYAVRVSLVSFVPAVRDRLQVKAGMRSLLEVNLSRVFSSIQVVATAPIPGSLMSDDWKWTLRASQAQRPILRFLPGSANAVQINGEPRSAVFSNSRGMLRLSASDGAQNADNGEADLGTQFAFATSVSGGNRVKVAGNLGYSQTSGQPAAAVRTSYSRDMLGESPEFSVTMRQVFVPLHGGEAAAAAGVNGTQLPALRTISISTADKRRLTDRLSAEYGFELDAVSFIDRLHYLSPYGRLRYDIGHGSIDATWTSGNARPELGIGAGEQNADLQRDLTSLSLLPRITLEDGHTKVQRADNYELGITQRFGSREFRASTYMEDVHNTSLMLAHADADLMPGDLLPDLFSRSSLFNLGTIHTYGYLASVTQDLGANYHVTLMYGSRGALAPADEYAPIQTAADLRHVMEVRQRDAITLRGSGTVKATGTRFVASYQWTSYNSVSPAPLFTTEARPEPGLNFMVRQPIPTIPGMPGHMEATAELRNMLGQGYLPLNTLNGIPLLLVTNPRSIRGSLAFVF